MAVGTGASGPTGKSCLGSKCGQKKIIQKQYRNGNYCELLMEKIHKSRQKNFQRQLPSRMGNGLLLESQVINGSGEELIDASGAVHCSRQLAFVQ